MDGTRPRRTHDPIRQAWYAHERQRRFARHMNMGASDDLRQLAVAAGFNAEWARAAELKYGRAFLADAVGAVRTAGFTPAAVAAFAAGAGPVAFSALLDAIHEVQEHGDPEAFAGALWHIQKQIGKGLEQLHAENQAAWQRFVAWVKGLVKR